MLPPSRSTVRTSTGQPACFDRRTDPGFERPLPPGPLLDELVAWRAARQAEGKGAAVRRTKVDAELAQQLKELGYAEP